VNTLYVSCVSVVLVKNRKKQQQGLAGLVITVKRSILVFIILSILFVSERNVNNTFKKFSAFQHENYFNATNLVEYFQ
jgi:isoprenylcysteine carboxyl methyltransferase (ICMT) family protein YpbQ